MGDSLQVFSISCKGSVYFTIKRFSLICFKRQNNMTVHNTVQWLNLLLAIHTIGANFSLGISNEMYFTPFKVWGMDSQLKTTKFQNC